MKQKKNPTVAQRKFIKAHGLNAENWFVVKNTATELVIVHRHSDRTIRTIMKG